MEMMIPGQAFHIEGPLGSYRVTGDSGMPVTRWHCAKCASGIYLEGESDPGHVFLKVGSLDDASWVRPEMHIYASAKQPWLHIDDGLPQCDTVPEL